MKKKSQKILYYYRNISPPVKASLWFTVCSVLQKGIAMLTIPLFTRLLSLEQYGIFSVYQSWYSIISIFATLNLSMAVFNNGMIKFKHDKKTFISSMQGLSTSITVILFAIYLCNTYYWEKLLGLPSLFITAMFVQLLFEPAYLFWSAEQRFQYRYKGLVGVTMLITIMSPLLGFIAVISTDYKAEARVLSFVFVQVCVGLIFYIYNILLGKKIFKKDYWKFALRFNMPLIPHYLSGIILGQSDRIMISSMVGVDKAAIYSVAYNMSLIMSIITNAIGSSMVPFTYQKLEKKQYGSIGTSADQLLLLMFVGTSFVMLLGPELITMLASPEYSEAKWIIPPVVSAVYFMFLYPLFANIEFYFEKNQYVMAASVMGALINILLNWMLIPRFGYLVAGYTTLISYIIFVIMHYIFMRVTINIYIPNVKIYHIKRIFLLSFIMLAQTGICLFSYKIDIIRYIFIVLLVSVIVSKRSNIINILKINQ